MDLLPWCAVLRVARHFEAGAVKYGDRNWERGIPLSSFMDSAARHIAKYMDGQDDEDHLCAAAWNLLCAMWTEEKRPDLINIPTRPEYAGGAQYGREDEDEMVTETETNPALYAGMYAAAKKEPDERPNWPKDENGEPDQNFDPADAGAYWLGKKYQIEKVSIPKDASVEDYLEPSPLMQKVTEAVYDFLSPGTPPCTKRRPFCTRWGSWRAKIVHGGCGPRITVHSGYSHGS
jgi:hypothetical protein